MLADFNEPLDRQAVGRQHLDWKGRFQADSSRLGRMEHKQTAVGLERKVTSRRLEAWPDRTQEDNRMPRQIEHKEGSFWPGLIGHEQTT